MATVPFTWADIIGAANNFLENPFVAGCIIALIALGLVVKIADFLRGIIND